METNSGKKALKEIWEPPKGRETSQIYVEERNIFLLNQGSVKGISGI